MRLIHDVVFPWFQVWVLIILILIVGILLRYLLLVYLVIILGNFPLLNRRLYHESLLLNVVLINVLHDLVLPVTLALGFCVPWALLVCGHKHLLMMTLRPLVCLRLLL